ncbi:hypothetical protein FISHEDRAFT_59210 [Fistulina hepatica ATCC 64428]|uniref:Uncharacterized protein n=1 Tax=Fistulina hepatica ATCC 64428 TaxID=1128425 RepID=A0A0D7ABM9_9AGAR|nr:hypothetical protein FISHEDRAFT_59210 [Fistulina hepatica ATCC 64428]
MEDERIIYELRSCTIIARMADAICVATVAAQDGCLIDALSVASPHGVQAPDQHPMWNWSKQCVAFDTHEQGCNPEPCVRGHTGASSNPGSVKTGLDYLWLLQLNQQLQAVSLSEDSAISASGLSVAIGAPHDGTILDGRGATDGVILELFSLMPMPSMHCSMTSTNCTGHT